ncbi:unnamed protein product, partial [Mesorhabditis spiculigera]
MGLDVVQDADIDDKGKFKYVLIKVIEKSTKEQKFIVRGYKRHPYHADICDEDFKMDCVGGGRIEHNPDAKSIFVYGYSVGFGKADHEISVDILKKAFPDCEVTWSNDGY